MAAWDPSQGFLSYRDTTQAVYVLLHCIRATISGQSRLTSSQTAAMLAWGQQELAHLHEWLRDLEWTGLHTGCLAIAGDAAAILSFPHIASHYLVEMIIDPLITLYAMPGGLALVSGSEELVSTLERTWAAARLVYPDFVDEKAGFVWSSGLDRIDIRLAELRAAVTSCPSGRTPLQEISC